MKKITSFLLSFLLVSGLIQVNHSLWAKTKLNNVDEDEEIKSTIHTDPEYKKSGSSTTKTKTTTTTTTTSSAETQPSSKPKSKSSLVKLDEKGEKILVAKQIRFDDQNNLAQGSQPVVLALVDFLKKNPQLRTRIAVFTDSLGTDQKNLEATQKRAQSLGIFLIQSGIDMSRFELVGMGDRDLLASDLTSEGREKNRRVEFLLLTPVPTPQAPVTPPPPPPVPETPPAPVSPPPPPAPVPAPVPVEPTPAPIPVPPVPTAQPQLPPPPPVPAPAPIAPAPIVPTTPSVTPPPPPAPLPTVAPAPAPVAPQAPATIQVSPPPPANP